MRGRVWVGAPNTLPFTNTVPDRALHPTSATERPRNGSKDSEVGRLSPDELCLTSSNELSGTSSNTSSSSSDTTDPGRVVKPADVPSSSSSCGGFRAAVVLAPPVAWGEGARTVLNPEMRDTPAGRGVAGLSTGETGLGRYVTRGTRLFGLGGAFPLVSEMGVGGAWCSDARGGSGVGEVISTRLSAAVLFGASGKVGGDAGGLGEGDDWRGIEVTATGAATVSPRWRMTLTGRIGADT